MEELIKIKSEAGIQLTDRELAIRWWRRLPVEEKENMLKKYLPSHSNININYETVLDYDSMYWIWSKKQTL